jgi:hypothetical protein
LGSQRATALALPAIAAIALRLREGDRTAADKAVWIKAAMALLDAGKGVSVNVQVNNQTKNTTATGLATCLTRPQCMESGSRARSAPSSARPTRRRTRLTASPNDRFTAP